MLMTGTLNLMFDRMNGHIQELIDIPKGIGRQARLEKMAEDMSVFLVMAADLAVMVEDLEERISSLNPHLSLPLPPKADEAESTEAKNTGQYL